MPMTRESPSTVLFVLSPPEYTMPALLQRTSSFWYYNEPRKENMDLEKEAEGENAVGRYVSTSCVCVVLCCVALCCVVYRYAQMSMGGGSNGWTLAVNAATNAAMLCRDARSQWKNSIPVAATNWSLSASPKPISITATVPPMRLMASAASFPMPRAPPVI
jgi:hypothetical protein